MTREEELDKLTDELAHINEMTDEEVCKEYNVDYRHEIVDTIKEEIETLEKDYEDEDEDEYYDNTLDPAFNSLEEFYRMVF